MRRRLPRRPIPSRLPFLRVLHLSVFTPVGETVARLNEFQPEFVTGYTSSLEALAREGLPLAPYAEPADVALAAL